MRNSKLSTLILFLLLPVPVLAAPVGEHAGEILVDGPLDAQPGSDPSNPDAVIDKSGRSIFVWNGTPAGTRKEVFLRIFPADGGPPGDPVQVNTYDDNNQHFPRVAVRDDGSFLVAWLSAERPEPEDNFFRNIIRSQAFDADANPVGGEQILSELKPLLTTGNKVDVAALPGGDYIVAIPAPPSRAEESGPTEFPWPGNFRSTQHRLARPNILRQSPNLQIAGSWLSGVSSTFTVVVSKLILPRLVMTSRSTH